MITARTFLRAPGSSPFLMGVLNVTPDSFSDGGRWTSADTAIEHALEMVEQGADIIDIGGESTRPGAVPVSQEIELERVIPVLKDLIPSIDVPVSVDTMKASVAEACIGEGVSLVNDVGGLADPGMVCAVRDAGVPVVIMSSHGGPFSSGAPAVTGSGVQYARKFLEKAVGKALDAGIAENMIITDPGIGFGMSSDQSMDMLTHVSEFSLERFPVLVGPSRKRFLFDMFPGKDPDAATAEACLVAAGGGADALRVHDVAYVSGAFRRYSRRRGSSQNRRLLARRRRYCSVWISLSVSGPCSSTLCGNKPCRKGQDCRSSGNGHVQEDSGPRFLDVLVY